MRAAGAAQSPGVGAVAQVRECCSSASAPLTAESSGCGLDGDLGSPQPVLAPWSLVLTAGSPASRGSPGICGAALSELGSRAEEQGRWDISVGIQAL